MDSLPIRILDMLESCSKRNQAIEIDFSRNRVIIRERVKKGYRVIKRDKIFTMDSPIPLLNNYRKHGIILYRSGIDISNNFHLSRKERKNRERERKNRGFMDFSLILFSSDIPTLTEYRYNGITYKALNRGYDIILYSDSLNPVIRLTPNGGLMEYYT